MLGFFNTTPSRHIAKGFSFPAIDRTYPAPDKIISAPTAGSTHALSDMSALDTASNGISVVARFKNENWSYGSNEIFLWVGDASNYIYFQKRSSGLKFRWGVCSGGTFQLIDEIPVDYFYDGNMTIGVSVGAGRINFCINGYTMTYQTDGITLPDIDDADNVYIGYNNGSSQTVNSTVEFDTVLIWDTALSVTEIENATFEAEPLIGVTKDTNLWTIIKAGQSNSKGNDAASKPSGYDYTNPSRIKMINKDLNIRAYADPYSTLTYGNELAAFDDVGGFSAAGVTIDELATAFPTLQFAAMPCNRGGSGMLYDAGNSVWADISFVVSTTGTPKNTSLYAFACHVSMLVAAQKSNLLAFEWYQGEADAITGTGVTKVQYKNALAELFDSWRTILPPLRVVIGLADEPDTGFDNWATIQDAQSEFSYADTYHVSAAGLERKSDDQVHLTGVGQRDLGYLVAVKLKENINS